MNKSYIIGVAGGSGSGKTTFSKRLKEKFGDDIVILSCDNYYLPHDELTLEEKKLINFDHPDSLEFDLLLKHLEALRKGEDVDIPIYDFASYSRSNETKHIESRPVVVVDGILILQNKKLRNFFDLNIYVEADADERILRRAKRDMNERGRSLDSIIDQYLTTVKPMHNKFVEPSKKFADVILNSALNDVAFDITCNQIEKKINEIKEDK